MAARKRRLGPWTNDFDFAMLKNYLKSWRNLLRHKGYSFINIAGLAIGMAACILIFFLFKTKFRLKTAREQAAFTAC
jgi:hypothetical protein